MDTNGRRYLELLALADDLLHTPRWIDGPRTEAEVDAASIRRTSTSAPSPVADELMQIILDADSLGRATLRGGLPSWALSHIDRGFVLTVLLAFRDPARVTAPAGVSREHARRALQASAMTDNGLKGQVLRTLLEVLSRRLAAYENDF